MYSFLKAFLVLMKLFNLSQFYAPNLLDSVVVFHCYFNVYYSSE